jgi:hypothetical protein
MGKNDARDAGREWAEFERFLDIERLGRKIPAGPSGNFRTAEISDQLLDYPITRLPDLTER